jgi:MYXO-CTERM domain-containing protein
MKLGAGIVVVGCLVATTARADMIGPGEKSVKLSIQVDATVPAGKALIIANTFRGADIVVPNTVTPVEWHPLGGDLQIKLVAKAEADKLPPLRENLDRDAIKPIAAKGVDCGPAFAGIRTISDSSPATSVRWTYRVTIDGDKCSSERVRMEYLDKDDKAVAAPGTTDIPPPSPPDVKAAPTKAEPAKTEPPAKAEAAPKAAAGGCGCTTTTAPTAGLGVFVLGLLLRRRRG